MDDFPARSHKALVIKRSVGHAEIMSIPGLLGASEPAFRTRDARWMGLDSIVQEVAAALGGIDELSLVALKSTIQMARQVVQEPVERTPEALYKAVSDRLRRRGVLMPATRVANVLAAYASVIVSLEVLGINEIG